jgi:hypothetical protein
MDNLNISKPHLGQRQPLYPPLYQLLRVTSVTIPGPTGGTSAGVGTGNIAPSLLYISSTQQLRTDTLSPRDREPCLVDDVNNVGLTSLMVNGQWAYFLGRLAGSYQSLPVYEVAEFAGSGGGGGGSTFPLTVGVTPVGGGVPGSILGVSTAGLLGQSPGLPGVTYPQFATVYASLTPTQFGNLNNLTACQLQVLLQLPVVNIQLLSTLSPTQLANVVDSLTYTQLSNIVTHTSPAQVTVTSSAYPQLYQAINQLLTPTQALTVLSNLSSQQVSTLVSLTPAQLQTIAQLTITQLQTLTNLTQTQVTTLVGQLTTVQLTSLLTTLTSTQLQQLTNNYTVNQITQLVQSGVTATQLTNLTNQQISTLVNLTSTQLQVVSQLTITQLQTLTGLTVTQVATLVGQLPAPQLTSLLTVLTTTQLQQLTNNLTIVQIGQLTITFTTSQIATLLSILTTAQLQTLQSPVLGNQGFFPQIPGIFGQPSSTPNPVIAGYDPVVVDNNTGKLWGYINGGWVDTDAGEEGVTGSGATNEIPVWDSATDLTGYANLQWVSNMLTLAGQTNGAGTGVGTLTNAPVSGNPSTYLLIKVNGAVYGFPGWLITPPP